MQDKSQARKGAGVANVVRQTWDRAHYDKLAKLRADGQVEHEETKNVITSSKEEFQTASEGAAGPAGSARAFLKARSSKISLENSVGTVKVVKSDDLSKSSGYYCEVCECSLKDSVAYLDHINGKKHYEKKLKVVEEEEARVKRRKNEQKKVKKLGKTVPQSGQDGTDNAEKKEVVDEVPNAEMMAMMGFSGFGGSNKS
uniref:C2H2-type domain-containing protein n=1 Tax=Hyaloperonospora arabidopsidis (strain Emoy2) TaxID=559515 RepID=M4B875_HYAAE